jgi:hypothetical protein
MSNSFFTISLLICLPLFGTAFVARSLFISLLGFIASLGMASSRDASGRDNSSYGDHGNPTQDPYDSSQMIKCYTGPVRDYLMKSPGWKGNTLLESWASAEREIRDYDFSETVNIEDLSDSIGIAETAAGNAKQAVKDGVLNQETYDMAKKILHQWHRDLVLNFAAIECYKPVAVKPDVSNISQRMLELERLQAKDIFDDESTALALESIHQEIKKNSSPAIADELYRLISELLGY